MKKAAKKNKMKTKLFRLEWDEKCVANDNDTAH